MTTAETTRKSLAAKLKEAIDTITHTHVGWKAESNAWRAVREVITALESSESLTGRAGNEGSGNAISRDVRDYVCPFCGRQMFTKEKVPKQFRLIWYCSGCEKRANNCQCIPLKMSSRPDSGLTALKEAVEAQFEEWERDAQKAAKNMAGGDIWLTMQMETYQFEKIRILKLIKEREQASK